MMAISSVSIMISVIEKFIYLILLILNGNSI